MGLNERPSQTCFKIIISGEAVVGNSGAENHLLFKWVSSPGLEGREARKGLAEREIKVAVQTGHLSLEI